MRGYSNQNLKFINTLIKIEGVEKEISSHFFFDPDSDEINTTPIVTECFGITFPDPKYRVIREDRPNFILEYVVEGEGEVTVDGNKFKVKAGDSYFLFPNTKQDYCSNKKNPFKKYWINFRGKMIDDIIKSMGLYGINYFPNTDLNSYFLSLFTLDDESLLSKDISYSVFSIVVNMLIELQKSRANDTHLIPSKILEIEKQISDSINNNTSINEICKKYSISKSYLDREFKKFYGISPNNYRNKKRIDIARAYLVNTNESVEAIAEMLHYDDTYHFSHSFKKAIGISPLKYRKQNRLR